MLWTKTLWKRQKGRQLSLSALRPKNWQGPLSAGHPYGRNQADFIAPLFYRAPALARR
jgi:hypothetical protein